METGNVGEFSPNLALSPFLLTVRSNVHGKKLHIRIWGRPSLHTRASFTSPQKLLLSQLSTMGYAPALRWLYLGEKNFKNLVNQPLIIWARKHGSQVPRACSRMELGCSVQKSMCCWSCGPSTPWKCS